MVIGNASSMTSSRTRGITILAIVEVLLGIFALVGGIIHLTLGIGGLSDFNGKDLTLSSQTATVLQDAFTAEGIVLLLAAYAVWSAKKWGWTLTIAISTIGLVTSIAALAIQSALSPIGLVANIGIITYAVTKPVKAHFGRGTTPAKPA